MYLKDMECNVTVPLDSQDADVKLTSTSAQVNLVITVVHVPTCHKDTAAHVLQDMAVSTVKKKGLSAEMTPALRELCAKMNLGSITTLVYVDQDTRALIVTSRYVFPFILTCLLTYM